MDVGEEDIIYLSLHCHHQNDFCIKMGSDESHFNVSLTVRDRVTRQCPETTIFEEKGEPKRIRTEVPLLPNLTPCQTSSPVPSSAEGYIRAGMGGKGGAQCLLVTYR